MYKRFEELLEAHNITAYRVAKETGVTTATLTSWKQGKYTPKRDKLQKIANYFGVPVDYFSSPEPMLEIIKQSTVGLTDNISTHLEYSIEPEANEETPVKEKKIVHVFRPKKGAPPIPTIQLSNKQIFSNSDKVIIKMVEEILDELLDDEQKEEFNQKLDECLPKFSSKETTLAAHFDGDDLTEDELKEIRQFAEFVKNKRKS